MEMEYLSQITKCAVKVGQLELHVIGGVQVEPLLIFANDVVFFRRASSKSLNTIKSILHEFLHVYRAASEPREE